MSRRGRPTPSPGAAAHDADVATRLAAAKLWLVSTESPTSCGGMPYLACAVYALVPVTTDRVARVSVDTSVSSASVNKDAGEIIVILGLVLPSGNCDRIYLTFSGRGV